MPELNITPDDLQAVMQSDPTVALKLQLTAALRTIDELKAEVKWQLARNGHGNIKAKGERVDAKGRQEALSVHGKGQGSGTSSG